MNEILLQFILYTLANVVSYRRCPATNKKPPHQPQQLPRIPSIIYPLSRFFLLLSLPTRHTCVLSYMLFAIADNVSIIYHNATKCCFFVVTRSYIRYKYINICERVEQIEHNFNSIVFTFFLLLLQNNVKTFCPRTPRFIKNLIY